jgi:hypothetical protein
MLAEAIVIELDREGRSELTVTDPVVTGVAPVPVINFTSKRVIARRIHAICTDIKRFLQIYT